MNTNWPSIHIDESQLVTPADRLPAGATGTDHVRREFVVYNDEYRKAHGLPPCPMYWNGQRWVGGDSMPRSFIDAHAS